MMNIAKNSLDAQEKQSDQANKRQKYLEFKKEDLLAIDNNETSMTTFRHKKVKFPLLDKAMQLWVKQVISDQIFLTDLIIKEKAAFFAWALGLPDSVLKFSNDWVYKFKKQKKLRNYQLHREANNRTILSDSTTSNALIATTIRIEKGLYCDRTRITVILTANATGSEKLKLIVIGSSIEPHALARLNYDTLPLIELDKKFRLENWHILLSVDGASSHYNPNESNENNDEDNDSNEDVSESDEELNSEEEKLENLTSNSLDPATEREINNFNNLNNSQILTEDTLDEMQIVNIVLYEQQEYEESDTSDTNDEPSEVFVVEGLDGLKKFVSFFEQQKSDDFNVEDLKVFRKYVSLIGRKYTKSMNQKSISDFFLPV
ncbi:304_t:CDS:2 [Scutellospora calospora]|uniref:304_t:CDS:1 n=1 Tax=Scutellospora calospora TaxID=85575 RepID=A0ACA9K311_9GLOM|nr:304_t:CDS:2 [Scutellospora calospora]